PKSAEGVPKSAEDTKLAKMDGQQLQVYNYVLANEAITSKEAKVLLGLQDRRARKILADMCNAGVLMKVGATSNLKYVLQKIGD
ncbi:MAG: ATP-binding protein, partial [Agathobacter sp.]